MRSEGLPSGSGSVKTKPLRAYATISGWRISKTSPLLILTRIGSNGRRVSIVRRTSVVIS